jgi:hypothetical protein
MRSLNPGDPVIWTNPTTGTELASTFVGTYGRWSIIETVTESGHLGLRYVHPTDVRTADNGTPEHL